MSLEGFADTKVLPRGRRWAIHFLIFGLGGASLWTLAADQEYWPFSSYSMFSDVQRVPELSTLELWGMTAAPLPVEVPINRPEELAPFDADRLSAALVRMISPPGSRVELGLALRDCLARCNRFRARRAETALSRLGLYAVHRRIHLGSSAPDLIDARQLLATAEAASSSRR